MSSFVQQTEYLAKLMAQENINVRFSAKDAQARFDLDSRTLHFPIFENLKSAETDLIIGHEIAHALETPCDAWITALDKAPLKENNNTHKEFYRFCVNAVEDARIEKLIKTRYPGMKKVFHYGYDQLFERGLFGPPEKLTESVNSNKFFFVEKLNFHFKIPAKIYLDYNHDMNYFIDKVEKVITFNDVVSVANELYNFSINEIEKDIKLPEYNQAGFSDSEEDPREGNSENTSEDSDSSSDNMSPQDSGEAGKGDESTGQNNNYNPYSGNELNAVLDDFNQKNFDVNYNNFLNEKLKKDKWNNYHGHVIVPTAVLENIIVPYTEILRSIRENEVEDIFNRNVVADDGDDVEVKDQNQDEHENVSYYKFVKQRKNTVENYSKNFQMKKKAHEFNRTLQYKTGSIDFNRLSYFKTSENIFKTNQYVTKGKNHAYIMILDFSASMYSVMKNVIKQALELVTFCRSNNVPINVYAFSNSLSASDYSFDVKNKKWKDQFLNGNLDVNYQFSLLELFHHNMKKSEFMLMADSLLSNDWYKTPNTRYFILGGTPLGPAIMTVPSLVKQLRKETHAEIVHCIFLTDGDDTILHKGAYGKTVTIQDYETKKYIISDITYSSNMVHKITQLISLKMNDVHIINFYIKNHFRSKDCSFYSEETDEKNKMGFDKLYYVKPVAFSPNITRNNYQFKKEQKVLIDSFINAIS